MRDSEILVNTAEDLVKVIQHCLEKSLAGSKRYSFVHVEAIPKFIRNEVSVQIPLKGIRSLHSFSVVDGGILASQLSCLQCSVSGKCAVCRVEKLSISKETVEAAVKESQRDLLEDSDGEVEAECQESDAESEDDDASDGPEDDVEVRSSSDSEGEEEVMDLTDPGSVVWVLWVHRRYPAKKILLTDLPPDVRTGEEG